MKYDEGGLTRLWVAIEAKKRDKKTEILQVDNRTERRDISQKCELEA